MNHIRAKAIKEIIAKQLAAAQSFQGPVGRGDDAAAKSHGFMAANRTKAPLLQHLEQFDLNGGRDVADFIEENRAVGTAAGEQALVRLDCACKSALAVTKQLRLDESLRELRKVQGNEPAHKTLGKTALFRIEGNKARAPNCGGSGAFARAGLPEEERGKVLHPVPKVALVKADFLREDILPKMPPELAHTRTLANETAGDEIIGPPETELEPVVVPNLYFGAPVRVYGRYRGNGTAQVTLRGSIQGAEFKEAAQLDFPKSDFANPEIDRLWAWHRINSLLKEGDRKGDRSPVAPEIVRLGEDFSIVTEYTSFLVLENDAEYQRWKIARRNLAATSRDRQVQAKRREQLDAMRNKALSEIGPQAAAPVARTQPVQMASASQAISQPTAAPVAQPRSQPQPERRQSWNLHSTGSGPVGPLGLLAALWFLRRKRKAE